MSGIHLLITAAEFVYCATCNKGEGFFPSWSIWPSIIAHMNQVQAANLLHISTQRGSVLVISYFLISCSLGCSDCNTTNSRYFKQTLSREWRGTEKDLLDLRASAFPRETKERKMSESEGDALLPLIVVADRLFVILHVCGETPDCPPSLGSETPSVQARIFQRKLTIDLIWPKEWWSDLEKDACHLP